MIEQFAPRYAYVLVAVLLGVGLYGLLDRNLIKKVIGLNIFQTGIFLFFIVVAYRSDGNPPLVQEGEPFVNPLPHVVVLTAIVVGVSVTALSLGLVYLLYTDYGTLREDEIRAAIDGASTSHQTAADAKRLDDQPPDAKAATDQPPENQTPGNQPTEEGES